MGRASPRGAQEALLAAAGGAELYAALLCQFEPAGVLPFLQVGVRGSPSTAVLSPGRSGRGVSGRWECAIEPQKMKCTRALPFLVRERTP